MWFNWALFLGYPSVNDVPGSGANSYPILYSSINMQLSFGRKFCFQCSLAEFLHQSLEVMYCMYDGFFTGTHFSKAIFVPSMSAYNKITSGTSTIPLNIPQKDLSWQFNLQRVWERIRCGKGDTSFLPCKLGCLTFSHLSILSSFIFVVHVMLQFLQSF